MLSQVINIPWKTIFRWYKDVLSWFNDDDIQEDLHKYDTIDPDVLVRDKETWEKKPQYILTPIFKEENIWEDMIFDDKEIWWIWYLILANKVTQKIAIMISTTKLSIAFDILRQMPQKIRNKVKTVSRDLAPWYDEFLRYLFFKCTQIADKFHVIQLALRALQDIRVRYRQEVLTQERLKKQNKKKKKKYWEKKDDDYNDLKSILPNWDTIKQLLARSRFLLFKFERSWSDEQKQRAEILFKMFPEIELAYKTICSFRSFYNIKYWKPSKRNKAKKFLKKWYRKARKAQIPEILNLVHTIENHEGTILNYFEKWHTNAKAENLNCKIQRFIWQNYWIRNRDFVHFRMKEYFS